MLTQDQWIISIGLFIIIILATVFLTWELAVGRYHANDKKRDKKIKEADEKYERILKKLEEDELAYATGLGAIFAIQSMDAALLELKKMFGVEK